MQEFSYFTMADAFLPKRSPTAHKGNFGHLLVLGGCVGYTGAPTLAAKAALRAGAGLVSVGVPQDIYEITAVKNDEAMPFPLPSENGKLCARSFPDAKAKIDQSEVIVLGPGLGRSEGTDAFVTAMLDCHAQLVLDADALFTIGKDLSLLDKCQKVPVLTPHEGEFLRLGGKLTGNRPHDAVSFAVAHRCILVLKGHKTVTAFPDGTCRINTCGGPELAKGGSGDVLSGIIGALLCVLPPRDAVPLAVFVHGLSGVLAAGCLTEHCVLATDLISSLPLAYSQILDYHMKEEH